MYPALGRELRQIGYVIRPPKPFICWAVESLVHRMLSDFIYPIVSGLWNHHLSVDRYEFDKAVFV